MKIRIILLAIAAVGLVVFVTACKKQGVQADVEAAVAHKQYKFIAVLGPDGKWTLPEVPGIPVWYFDPTTIRPVMARPESKDADLAYMKSYNETLYRTLKAQGKFHIIEENIARVKANMDKYEQSKQAK